MHHTSKFDGSTELVFFDEANPRSLINLVPAAFAKRMRAFQESPQFEFFGKPQNALSVEFNRAGKAREPTDNKLRQGFWLEYARIQSLPDAYQDGMNFSKILKFYIPKEAFYFSYIQCHWNILWLLCPPVSYQEVLEDAFLHATTRLMGALTVEINRDGELNLQVANFVYKVHGRLFEQVYGKAPKPDLVIPEVAPDSAEARDILAEIEVKRKKIEELKKLTEGTGATGGS